MGKINILDAVSANMIAAGEVVDRPSSALKELLENSVDAHSTSITVDIKNGGNSRIRVTDNGDGIEREDLPKALYRHATSKIKNGYEINGVKTLGFRGEALAASSAVSRMEIISKTREEKMGSKLLSDETGVELYETGCADGTTVIIDDLFYNVPARRKFMKKDASESASCIAVCEKLALSHPEISLTVFADGVRKMHTSGDGKLFSVMYSLYGGQTAKSFIPVEYENGGIKVEGYISKPDLPRGSRNMQIFFINGRYVKSKTVQAALEEAYRSYIPSGKFPAGILNLKIDPDEIDVNVHPAKTEIKFSDEKSVFSAVYYAVKNTHAPKTQDAENEMRDTVTFIPPKVTGISINTAAEIGYAQPTEKPLPSEIHESDKVIYKAFSPSSADEELSPLSRNSSPIGEFHSSYEELKVKDEYVKENGFIPEEQQTVSPVKELHIIGEAYNTFIFASLNDKILIVDKHAAHERILYEKLKDIKTVSLQTLLFPVTVSLSPSQTEVLLDNKEYLQSFGFGIEEFGPSTVAVREVPSALKGIDGISMILEGFAKEISESNALAFEEKVDKALYTMACKAAVKARERTSEGDNAYIIENILSMNLKYCPHGRPFVKEITKRELERFFDR